MSKAIMIYSRSDSLRLPKKALMNINGKTLLERVIERVKRVDGDLKIILATTIHENDDELVDIAVNNGILSFRGSIDDVLGRTCDCIKKYGASAIVRICGDSPLTAPELINKYIKMFDENDVDIVTNVFPRSYPKGLSCEVISSKTLLELENNVKNNEDREHITQYIYTNYSNYKIINDRYFENISENISLAIDTKQDYLNICKLYEELGDCPEIKDINTVIKVAKNIFK